MPFGNSVSASQDFKVQRPFDRLIAQQTWPAGHRLAHGPRTTAGAPLGRDSAAHVCVEPAHDVVLLAIRHQILEGLQQEPQRPHRFQDCDEAHAQHGHIRRRGARPFGRQQRAGQHQRRDFLRRLLDRVALQHLGFAQLPLQLTVLQPVLPAVGIQLRELQRRRRPRGLLPTRAALTPHIRFLSIGSCVCSPLPPDATSR